MKHTCATICTITSGNWQHDAEIRSLGVPTQMILKPLGPRGAPYGKVRAV